MRNAGLDEAQAEIKIAGRNINNLRNANDSPLSNKDHGIWSHHFKNFPQFVVIHTVKGFGIVNKTEMDVFLELSCFFDDPMDVGTLISSSSAFLNPA